MKNIILGVLKTESNGHVNLINACEDLNISFKLIDISVSNWVDKIRTSELDGIIYRPYHTKQYLKDMIDDRIYFIDKVLNIPIYPSYLETIIYENKNNMSYWLEVNEIPHAKTFISYNKDEALDYLKTCKYPIVFKTKIGSAGLGVKFLNNYKQGKKIVNKLFSKEVFSYKLPSKGYTKVIKGFYKNIIPYIIPMKDDKQHGFVLFQKKLEVKYEWRIIKIGYSYFGHQKLIGKSGKHSGSSKVGWVKPPLELLNLAREICDKGKFNSMNIDIFETTDGKYYVNELQTIFGSYDNSQMYIDNIPGRYKFMNNEWVFEEGYFNQNRSMNLRVEDFVDNLKRRIKDE